MSDMPIRNKSKDNPYTLGFDEDKNVYTVEFMDNMKVIHKVEISEKVYQAFDSFELEDISQIHKYRNVKQYEVVFPYQPGEFNRWQRVTPSYNLIHGYCTNGNKVDAIFDAYEDALNFVTAKNEELCKKSYIYLPYSENYAANIQAKKDEFNEKLTEYKLLEKQILLHTEDMEIGSKKELTNVIKIANNSGRVLSCSIYEILNLFDRDKFVAYSISKEQYANLMKLISEEKIEDIKSIIGAHQGLLLHKEKDDFIKLAIEEDCGAYYVQNNSVNYDVNLDKVNIKSFENIDEDTLIFYTTETMDDLLNSYKKHSEIDLREVQGPILKKTKHVIDNN